MKGNRRPSITELSVLRAIESYNKSLSTKGLSYELSIEVNRRVKKFYINANDFFEIEIGELLLWKKEVTDTAKFKEEPVLVTHRNIAYRIEHFIPNKDIDKRADKYLWVTKLYDAFIYECFGNFANVLNKLIDDEDMSIYDLEIDNYLGESVYRGKKLKVISDDVTSWYKMQQEYYIFGTGKDGYIVYTWGDEGKKHKGYGIIPFNHTRMVTPSIEV